MSEAMEQQVECFLPHRHDVLLGIAACLDMMHEIACVASRYRGAFADDISVGRSVNGGQGLPQSPLVGTTKGIVQFRSTRRENG